jgi:hypothetical protein
MKIIQIFYSILFVSMLACNLPDDTVVNSATLTICSQDKMIAFDSIINKMQGLGINTSNSFIGYKEAYWKGKVLPKKYYWKPINGKKMCLCGLFDTFSIYDGTVFNNSHPDEYDWNIDIIPTASFEYIKANKIINKVGAEITPDESLWENIWFPNRIRIIEGSTNELDLDIYYEQPNPIAFKRHICVYGPWVYDMNHTAKPEIHPSENIWWKVINLKDKIDTIYIFGIQDDSGRYETDADFDGYNTENWQPWARPPIKSEYLIPFEFSGRYTDHLIINIEELKAKDVVTTSIEGFGDSDNGKNHLLKLNGGFFNFNRTIVEVNENIPLPINLGIKFVDVCKKPSGGILGFVQISTAFGNGINGDEGYHILKLTIKYPKNEIFLEKTSPNEILK